MEELASEVYDLIEDYVLRMKQRLDGGNPKYWPITFVAALLVWQMFAPHSH